jgi:excisionase family DNA binding protein
VNTTPGSSRLLLSLPEAADVLHIGRTRLRDVIDAGDLETVRIGRRVLVPTDAVESFVRSLRDAG